mgnify:FL=1
MSSPSLHQVSAGSPLNATGRDVAYKCAPTLRTQEAWLPTLREWNDAGDPRLARDHSAADGYAGSHFVPPAVAAHSLGADAEIGERGHDDDDSRGDSPNRLRLAPEWATRQTDRPQSSAMAPTGPTARRGEELDNALRSLMAAQSQHQQVQRDVHKLEVTHFGTGPATAASHYSTAARRGGGPRSPEAAAADVSSMRTSLRALQVALAAGEEAAKRNAARVHSHVSTINKDVGTLNGEMDSLSNTLAMMQDSCDRVHAEVRQLRHELTAVQAERDDTISRMQQMMASLRHNLGVARREAAQDDGELSRLSEQNSFLSLQLRSVP